jgi:RNA polymerase sigma-70 factor, ECF subfamily
MTEDDEQRFVAVYNRLFRPVLRYALARVGPEQARDVVAETFLIAWRRFGELPAEPAAWLFGIARKVIAGQLRTSARQGALKVRLARTGLGIPGPADPAEEAAERDSALIALSQLGQHDQEVLIMAAWDGFSPEAGAEVLGITKAAYVTRLHRARKRLAAELAGLDAGKSWMSAPRHLDYAISRASSQQIRKAL